MLLVAVLLFFGVGGVVSGIDVGVGVVCGVDGVDVAVVFVGVDVTSIVDVAWLSMWCCCCCHRWSYCGCCGVCVVVVVVGVGVCVGCVVGVVVGVLGGGVG